MWIGPILSTAVALGVGLKTQFVQPEQKEYLFSVSYMLCDCEPWPDAKVTQRFKINHGKIKSI